MVKPGRKLNLDFVVKVVRTGGEQDEVSFSELITGPTVVSVYMRNNTSGCDLQMASLAKGAAAIRKLGYHTLAISRDTCGSHKKYAEKMGIRFPLVSDPEFQFAKATDSMVEKSMYGKKYLAPARAAYVLDADGTVKAVIEKVDTGDHTAQLVAVLKNL
ncbi:MAG: redoxin domain-containing protein [Opitutaceae bacterium]